MKAPHRLTDSFRDALIGIATAFREEKNMRIHFAVFFILLGASWYAGLNRWEWALVLLAAGLVITSEMLNSAVERVVDLVEPNFHPLAALSKRLAAGGVLIAALTAVAIGAIVFWPRLYTLWR
ncbi:MAG: diacylglycerol kinase family protein [Firmicutes bacterium]|nr:diacylglycerol kinase family protein [Dethiobacter sp.]MBS3888405.1 diacylglycerol kinase family protein [Bacillota bacterium]MBS4055461.1 diacylglycerol kinase family protein [Thermaerobacter sp.]